MKIRYVLFLSILVVMSAVLHSCDEEESNTPRVGLSLKNPTTDWRRAMRSHAVNILEEYVLPYSIRDAVDLQTERANLLSMVERNAEVVIVSTENNVTAQLDSINQVGIPLIFLEEAPISDYAALVQISNASIGESAAAFFNKQENLAKIALFVVATDEATSRARNESLIANLNPGIETIELVVPNYTANAGTTAAASILNEHTDVTAIYAQDDELVTGILSGIGESIQIRAIAGCGGSQSFFDRIRSSLNINLATTLYSPTSIIEAAIIEANDILDPATTTPVNKLISLPSQLVDRDNVDSMYAPY